MSANSANTPKSRFFREITDRHTNITSEDHIEDLIMPGTNLYVSPFSRNAFSKESIIETDDDNLENCFTLHRQHDTKYFGSSRRDLPQFFIDSRVQVRITPTMGKGCFALKDIEKNTIVESAPVILVPRETFSTLNKHYGRVHTLSEYPFSWGIDGLVAFSLGYGGIYNHKVEPNLSWRPDYKSETLLYTAIKDISAGEELFIRYLPVTRLDSLWFDDEESIEYARLYKGQETEDIPSLLKRNRAKLNT